MIATALQLELRTLLRSPLRLLIVLLVLATGVFVALQGQRDVERWRAAIASAREDEQESIDEARAYFEAEQKGPEDRPWVDLAKPLWQDWYAANRLAREPAPLAGIAFASAEAGAVAMRINRFANPLLAAGSKIENPALAVAGGLDLVTVLALLLPLMILALGVEVGGQERAMGILPLIRVQSGTDRAWIAFRCIAIGLLAAVAGLLLCGIATVFGGADLAGFLSLAALVAAYVALWTTLLTMIALLVKHPSQGAVAMGACWIALCVVIPAIGVERSASLAADDFALDLTVEARDAGSEFKDLSDEEVLGALFERFPELEELAPDEPAEARDLGEYGLRVVGLEARMAKRDEEAQAQSRLVERMSLLSPTLAFTEALEGLAGRSPESARGYRRAVASATADRVQRYIASSWRDEPLSAGDFEELVASTRTSSLSRVKPAWYGVSVLLAWTLALVGLTSVLTRRASLLHAGAPDSGPALGTATS